MVPSFQGGTLVIPPPKWSGTALLRLAWEFESPRRYHAPADWSRPAASIRGGAGSNPAGGTMSKMPGRLVPMCRVGKRCRCGNAHDGVGRKKERRRAKRSERNEARRCLK